MSAANYDIVIDQGSNFAIDVEVKESGLVKNLAGYAARASVKSSKSATTNAATFDCTIPVPTDGKVKMEMAASTTASLSPGQYFYDLEIHTSDNSIVKRLIEGTVNISAGITVGVAS